MSDFKPIFTEDDRIQILSDLVAIKSVNNNEQQVAEYLQQLLQQHGHWSQANRSSAKSH